MSPQSRLLFQKLYAQDLIDAKWRFQGTEIINNEVDESCGQPQNQEAQIQTQIATQPRSHISHLIRSLKAKGWSKTAIRDKAETSFPENKLGEYFETVSHEIERYSTLENDLISDHRDTLQLSKSSYLGHSGSFADLRSSPVRTPRFRNFAPSNINVKKMSLGSNCTSRSDPTRICFVQNRETGAIENTGSL
jgi:hypothetical protein